MAEARVYLVGAGPGDPDLLTVKALRLLRLADVVVFDRLVSDAILDLVPPGTARVFAGKQAGYHHMRQDDINDLLLRLARAGRTVVRLKGGDPFIFGRGSEEAEHLARHNIAFEVVPGITAAAGCSAYAGIPLTHRGLADSVRFVTGHGQDEAGPERDWAALADPDTTLVIYMGLRRLPVIVAGLLAGGLPDRHPGSGDRARHDRRPTSRGWYARRSVRAGGGSRPCRASVGGRWSRSVTRRHARLVRAAVFRRLRRRVSLRRCLTECLSQRRCQPLDGSGVEIEHGEAMAFADAQPREPHAAVVGERLYHQFAPPRGGRASDFSNLRTAGFVLWMHYHFLIYRLAKQIPRGYEVG